MDSALGKAGVEWSVAWQTDQLREGEQYGQGSLFGDDALPTAERHNRTHGPEWTRIIAANLKRLLDEVGTFRPVDYVPEVYGKTLGQASTPHVRAAVKLLSGTSVANTGNGVFWKEQLRRG